MSRIVKMAAVLPEDIVFELPGGAKYTVPGDPPLTLILKIAALFERAGEDQDDDGTVPLDLVKELDAEVLQLLRMRNENVEVSPFGVLGVQHFVMELLKQYQLLAGEDGDGASPPPKKARTKGRSRRSSGSPSSSTSSGSRRITT